MSDSNLTSSTKIVLWIVAALVLGLVITATLILRDQETRDQISQWFVDLGLASDEPAATGASVVPTPADPPAEVADEPTGKARSQEPAPEVQFMDLEDEPPVSTDSNENPDELTFALTRRCPLYLSVSGDVGPIHGSIDAGRWVRIIRYSDEISALPTHRVEGRWVLIEFQNLMVWIEEPCLRMGP